MNTLFNKFCSIIGHDREIIQGAGGNISYKDGDILLIKASGMLLADAMKKNIFVSISRKDVQSIIDSESEDFSSIACEGLHPSIETAIHYLLPQRYILHLHHLDAIVLSALNKPPHEFSLCERLKGLRFIILPYARPGLPLFRAMKAELSKITEIPNLIVLRNHGIVIAAETINELHFLVNDVRHRLFLPCRPLSVPHIERLASINDILWEIPELPYIHALAFDNAAPWLCSLLPLCPDHAVFLGSPTLVVSNGQCLSEALQQHERIYGKKSYFAVIPEAGVLIRPDITQGALSMLDAFGRMVLRIPAGADLCTLTSEDVMALCHWEAEKWRQSLDQERG